MENMCIISDHMKKKIPKEIPSHIEVHTWTESPKINLASFPIVVIDQMIEKVKGDSNFFKRMREKAISLLEYGGLIICLTYLTLLNESEADHGHSWKHDQIGRTNPTSGDLRRQETTYDWLPEDFSGNLGLLDFDTGTIGSKNIKVVGRSMFQSYFSTVEEIHKVFKGFFYKDGKAYFDFRSWNKERGRFTTKQYSAEPIAVVKHSGEPIAAIFSLLKGKVIFLPQNSNLPEVLIHMLYNLGTSFYEEEKFQILEERPDWVEEYISNSEKKAISIIRSREKEIQDLKNKVTRLYIIDQLLFSSGPYLEDGVEEVFKDLGLDYERTTKHEPYDFIVRDILDSGQVFIEVTGKKKIKQDSEELNQHMATHTRPEFNPQTDKYAFLLNCQRQKKPSERDLTDMITIQARAIINKFKIPIIFTYELFDIWKSVCEKKMTSDALDEAKRVIKERIESFTPLTM